MFADVLHFDFKLAFSRYLCLGNFRRMAPVADLHMDGCLVSAIFGSTGHNRFTLGNALDPDMVSLSLVTGCGGNRFVRTRPGHIVVR